MVYAFSIGSECAVMLPRELMNPQVTPALGMVINHLLDDSSLILVEEVWQFKGLEYSPLSEMCTSSGRVRQVNWGWQEMPKVFKENNKYLVVPAKHHNVMKPSVKTLEVMVKKSIQDFKALRGFI